MKSKFFSLLLSGIVFATWSNIVAAQDTSWAQKMFNVSKYDFGVVARGADVKHRFRVKNIYKETINIASVRTTCGCSAAKPSKTKLESGEEIYIEVTMDTRRFTRRKDSNLIVTFDNPFYAEVRIPITAYIRTDVVLTPGSINFGAVEKGTSATRKIEISYAGRNDWKITDLKVNSKYLEGKVIEKSRAGGQIGYELQVSLKPNAPAGALRDRVVLVTNDANSPYVPVLVQARVESDVTVTVASLGTLTPGQKKTFNVVIRGKKSFAIKKIECENADDRYKVRISKKNRKVHVLPVSFVPDGKPGPFQEKFTVTIEGRPEPVTFTVSGRIAAK
ncbi:MAG: DUF1573 domain-containing protein [Planctomycetaceae bacterium]